MGDASRQMRDDFTPPVLIGLFLVEEDWRTKNGGGSSSGGFANEAHTWSAPCSFVQFVCSHAFSDGYSGVPLIQDLAALYKIAEAKKRRGGTNRRSSNGHSSAAAGALVPLPPAATLEDLVALLCSTGRSTRVEPSYANVLEGDLLRWSMGSLQMEALGLHSRGGP